MRRRRLGPSCCCPARTQFGVRFLAGGLLCHFCAVLAKWLWGEFGCVRVSFASWEDNYHRRLWDLNRPPLRSLACSFLSAVLIGECMPLLASTEDHVQQAVQRATAYLIQTQARNGTWTSEPGHVLGETALAGLALLAGGKPVDHPAVSAAAIATRELSVDDWNTYDTALAIMFLDSMALPDDRGLLGRLGQRLVCGQSEGGAWTYSLQQGGLGGDNSNTQFAALASWVSRRHGVRDDARIQRLGQYLRNTFDPSVGGWGYMPGGDATPTMTCAGLVGIAIARGADVRRPSKGETAVSKQAAAKDPVAKRALEALGYELKKAERDRTAGINSDLYFFWSLERVGVVYDVKHIGGVDWYRWGSERLIAGQSSNGEWRGASSSKGWAYDGSIGTSFGILFLSKANVAADLTATVGSGEGVGEPAVGLGGGTSIIGRPTDGIAPPLSVPPTSNSKRGPGPRIPPSMPSVGPGVLDP